MSNLTVEVSPTLNKIGNAFQMIKMGAALQKAIARYAHAIRDEAVKQTPVDTGRLRASILTSIGTLEARIAPHVVYAQWIHEGQMKRNGQTIYIKGGGRAGTPPGGKPFMKLGEEAVFAKRQKLIEPELIDEIKSGLAGVLR